MSDAPDLDAFLARWGWRGAERRPLVGDASRRRYERVYLGDRTAVLMISPPDIDPSLPRFLDMTDRLRRAGLSAPEVFAAEPEIGLALLEDLGEALYSTVATAEPDTATEMLTTAAEVLVLTGALDAPAPVADAATLTAMLTPARDWVPGVDPDAFQTFSDRLEARLADLDAGPVALSLRDVQSANLLWLSGRSGTARVGLLDYQDAFRVHAAYDLVSLLTDVRMTYPPAAIAAARTHYARLSGTDPQDLDAAMALLTIQRNTRILGVFFRLARRDGKRGYVRFLDATYASLTAALAHPAAADLAPLFARAVPEPDPTDVLADA